MLAAAKRPSLYVGVGLRRHGLTELAEHLRLPLATDVLGKAAIPESHPQFAGVYMGVLGAPAVREWIACRPVIGRSRGSAAHQSRNSSRKTVRAQARSGSDIGPDATSLRVADILAALKRLDPSRYSFTADVGDSWFIALELRTEIFLAAAYYASMGFAAPARWERESPSPRGDRSRLWAMAPFR